MNHYKIKDTNNRVEYEDALRPSDAIAANNREVMPDARMARIGEGTFNRVKQSGRLAYTIEDEKSGTIWYYAAVHTLERLFDQLDEDAAHVENAKIPNAREVAREWLREIREGGGSPGTINSHEISGGEAVTILTQDNSGKRKFIIHCSASGETHEQEAETAQAAVLQWADGRYASSDVAEIDDMTADILHRHGRRYWTVYDGAAEPSRFAAVCAIEGVLLKYRLDERAETEGET